MDVTYHRGKLWFFALVLAGFAVISVYGVVNAEGDGARPFSRLFAVAVAAALIILAGKVLLGLLRGRVLVLTIGEAGITFHQPRLGEMPWSAIEGVVHKRTILQRSFGFRFNPPLPRLPLLARLLYLSYRITERQPAHLYLSLPLLACSEGEILEAIRRARRGQAA